jgi:hypothetical protein
VLLGDRSEAYEAVPLGEGGRCVRIGADRQQSRAQAVLQLRMEARAEHHGLYRERPPYTVSKTQNIPSCAFVPCLTRKPPK